MRVLLLALVPAAAFAQGTSALLTDDLVPQVCRLRSPEACEELAAKAPSTEAPEVWIGAARLHDLECDRRNTQECLRAVELYWRYAQSPRAIESGLAWARRGCEATAGRSCLLLGDASWLGHGVVADRREAERAWQRACSAGLGCDRLKDPRGAEQNAPESFLHGDWRRRFADGEALATKGRDDEALSQLTVLTRLAPDPAIRRAATETLARVLEGLWERRIVPALKAGRTIAALEEARRLIEPLPASHPLHERLRTTRRETAQRLRESAATGLTSAAREDLARHLHGDDRPTELAAARRQLVSEARAVRPSSRMQANPACDWVIAQLGSSATAATELEATCHATEQRDAREEDYRYTVNELVTRRVAETVMEERTVHKLCQRLDICGTRNSFDGRCMSAYVTTDCTETVREPKTVYVERSQLEDVVKTGRRMVERRELSAGVEGHLRRIDRAPRRAQVKESKAERAWSTPHGTQMFTKVQLVDVKSAVIATVQTLALEEAAHAVLAEAKTARKTRDLVRADEAYLRALLLGADEREAFAWIESRLGLTRPAFEALLAGKTFDAR